MLHEYDAWVNLKKTFSNFLYPSRNSQAEPAKRGTGQISMKDIGKLDQMAKQIEDLKSQVESSDGLGQTLEHLTEQMDKLKAETYKNQNEQNEDPKDKS